MNKSITYIVAFLLFIGFTSCKTPQAPEFKDVSDLNIELNGFTKLNVSALAHFYNPNKAKVVIKDASIKVLLEGNEVANIDEVYNITAEGNNDFSIPVSTSISLGNLSSNTLKHAMALAGGEGKKVTYSGYIKVNMHGITFKVPIKHTEMLQMNN